MIISASRRTDIPAFYSEWFINRLKAGFAFIQNPRNRNRIASVVLNPDVVDSIVFWTKNPEPMMKRLDEIDAMGYPYYFQFTLTSYDSYIEKGLPKKNALMDNFKALSDKIGPNRVIWRYDPIIVNPEFSVPYHLDAFEKMSNALGDYTNRCVFSFIDIYTHTKKGVKDVVQQEVNEFDCKQLAQGFSEIAKSHKLALTTCSESIDLSIYGIEHSSCIDQKLVEKILDCPIRTKKDPNQRGACGCIESMDIGTYDSCSHGCIYCYATTSEETVWKNMRNHDPHSSMLIGHPSGHEIVTAREAKSLKVRQMSLF